MHVVMLLMKLAVMCIALETLLMPSVYTIKVKPRHAIKCTVKIKRKASRELSMLSVVEEKCIIVVIVEEAIRMENVVKVGTASVTIK